MEWLQQNGFWIVVLVLFVLMHLGHGRGHGGHAGHRDRPGDEDTDTTMSPPRPARAATATLIREVIVLDTRVVTWSLATFSTVTFLVCVTFGLVVSESLHMSPLLEQVLPGFVWLTPTGFAIGLIEAFLYGAYAGLVFTPLYNAFHRRWGTV